MVPEIDESDWPIVRLTFGPSITFEEIDELARRLKGIHGRLGPMVTVTDISAMSATATTARHRQRIAQEADDLSRKGALLGEAVVIRNPIVRALFVGYNWLKTTSFPSRAFDDSASAAAWARTLLKADRIASKR
jgi:hypothetical protein